jgi:ATP-binding cassette subfamily B protein
MSAPKPDPAPPNKLPVLRALLPFIRPYRARVVLAGVFLVITALAALVLPVMLKQVIDQGFAPALQHGDTSYLKTTLWGLAIVGIIMSLGGGARFMIVTWLGERVVSDIRSAVYARLLQQPPEFFESLKTGEVLSRLTTDTTLIQTLVGSSLSMGLRNCITLVGAVIMLLIGHTKTTLIVLTMIAVMIGIVMLFSRRVRKLSRASTDRVADISSQAGETLNAMSTVQIMTQEGRENRRFAERVEDAFATAMKRTRVRAMLIVFIMLAFLGGILWGIWDGGNAVIRGETTFGQLSQFAIYALMVGSAAAVLAEVWGDALRAAGASERLVELLSAQPGIRSPAQPAALPATSGGVNVAFEQVEFAYPTRPERKVLHALSFKVNAGERVALVGPSGAGKSTVFALLARFYDVQGGAVKVAGVPVTELALDDLRRLISVVPQEPVIFSDNALENIRYGRPEASEAEVMAAARAAQAHDFISQLPEGYQTYLGERGVRLSGGQKQRIAIARAILRDAPLLLLDEATSALDAESEQAVQQALEVAMQGRTTLVIAHRLSTIQNADRILVFEDGRVVESGPHAQLVAAGGLYARLAALQSLAEGRRPLSS